MPYGEKSAYDAQEKLKGNSSAYKKTSGFKLRSKSVPFKDVEEKTSNVDVDPSLGFDPRGSGTYSDYIREFEGSKWRPKSKSWWGRRKEGAGKSSEAGYMGVDRLARAGQLGGTAEWEEEKAVLTKKSPTKLSYFSGRSAPVMKKPTGFKMKGSSYKKKYKK